MRRALTTAALLLVVAGPSAAQDVIVGVDVRRDRFSYRFENSSTFDTTSPVPHFFEQRYTADDYDTFFEPDATVIVSGTTGDASMRSLSVGQKTVTRDGALVSAGDVTSPETTRSEVHELLLGATRTLNARARWRMEIEGELTPAAGGARSYRSASRYSRSTAGAGLEIGRRW